MTEGKTDFDQWVMEGLCDRILFWRICSWRKNYNYQVWYSVSDGTILCVGLIFKIEHWASNTEHRTLNIVNKIKNFEHWTLISMSDGTIVCVGLILNVAGSLRGSNQKPKFDHTAVPHASTDGTLMGGSMPHTWKSNNARKYYQVAGGKCHKCSMGKHQL